MAYVSNTDPAIKRLQKQGVTTSGASSSASSGASAASTSKSSNTGTKTAYVSSTDPAIRRLRGESVYTSSSDSLAVNKKDEEKNTAKKTTAQSIASNKGSQTTGGTFLGGWKQPDAKEKKNPTAAEIAAQQKEAEEAAKRLSYLETLDLDEQQKKIDALTAESKKGAKLNVHAFGAYDPNNLTETEMALAEAQEDYNLAKSLQYSAKGKKALEALDLGAQRLVDTVAKYNIEARGLRSSDMPTEAERETALKGLLSRGMTMEEIEQLADYRARQLNEQEYDAKVRKMQELASRDDLLGISDMGAVAASIASIPLNLGSGAGYLDLLMQKAHNKQMGYDRPLDYKTGAMSLYGQASAARETVSQGIMDNADTELGGQVGSFLYQTGMSMADSAVVAGLGVLGLGASGTLLLGGSAATAAAVDAKNRGGSDSQALWSGALAGAAETVFEKVSLDNLLTGKLTKNFVGGEFKKLLADVGVQGAVEGSEELFTAFANHITDRAIMGGSSVYAKSIREYMAAGMTAEEAKAKATADFAAECATSFVGGVLSGGVMGGVANAARYSYGTQGSQATRKAEAGASEQDAAAPLSEAPVGEEAVKDFASAMDKAGATAMTRLYSPEQEPTAYIEGMMKAYNAGKTGADLNTVEGLDAITPVQAEGAYLAGQADAENATAKEPRRGLFKRDKARDKTEDKTEEGNVWDAIVGTKNRRQSPGNSLENADSAAYTETTIKEDVTNEQEGNASSSGGYGRASGVLAEERSGSVQSGTGSAEARGETQRLRAEKIRAAVQAEGVGKVNTASLGISTGTTRETLQVVPAHIWTDEMRSLSREQEKQGRQVIYFTGEMELRDDGGTFRARGAISPDGKRIWVRADHDTLTVEQIVKHEEFHGRVKQNAKLMEDTASQIVARYGDEELAELVEAYIEKYGFTNVSLDYVLEEILADAYGGIDIFDYLTNYEGATRYSDVVRETVKLSEKEKANPIRGPTEVKASRERRAQRGRSIEIETMENNRFERLRQFYGDLPSEWYAFTSDYFYLYRNHSYTSYTIISKLKLLGNKVFVDQIIEEVKTNAFRTSEDYHRRIKALQLAAGRHRSGNANASGQRGSAVGNGGVSGHNRGQSAGQKGNLPRSRENLWVNSEVKASLDALSNRIKWLEKALKSSRYSKETKQEFRRELKELRRQMDERIRPFDEVKTSRETDSEGKALTEEQAAYFADSKSVDAQGRLRVMYRGGGDFTVFDRKKSSYSNLYGRGFYFTDSKSHAEQYGGARAFYLNIKSPVPTDERTITKEQLLAFLRAVAENEDDYSFENYGYGATPESVADAIFTGKSDFAMLYDVSQTAIGDMVEAVELFNAINGTNFDGLILDTETVTFRSEQAKSVSNKKPTSDPDIRFSREKGMNDYLADLESVNAEIEEQAKRGIFAAEREGGHEAVLAYLKRKDSLAAKKRRIERKIRELSQPVIESAEQIDSKAFKVWFGDWANGKGSKVVDADGKPLVVYHGTGTTIEEFLPEFTGQGNDQYGSGFYFTTDKSTADGYTTRTLNEQEKLGGSDNPNVIPVYLNIRHPLVVDAAKTSNLYSIDVSPVMASRIISRMPDIMDPEESILGDYFDEYWERGPKNYMISQLAREYEWTLGSLATDIFRDYPTEFRQAVKDVLGYDGVQVNFTNGEKHFVAWFPNQIKHATENTGAFSKRDNRIKFSREMDSEGRQLSNEQAEFFKDSKVRDENGNLKRLFHGTPRFGFTVFDKNKLDDGFSIFMTDSVAVAESYSGTLRVRSAMDDGEIDFYSMSAEELAKWSNENTRDGRLKPMSRDEVKAERNKQQAKVDETVSRYRDIAENMENIITKLGGEYTSRDEHFRLDILDILDRFDAADTARRQIDLLEKIQYTVINYRLGASEAARMLLVGLSDVEDAINPLWRLEELSSPYDMFEVRTSSSTYFRDIEDVREGLEETARDEDGYGNYAVYANITNPFIINGNERAWNELILPKKYRQAYIEAIGHDPGEGRIYATTRDVVKVAKHLGHDGVIFNDIIDVGAEAFDAYVSNVYVAFESNQVKDVDNLNPTSDPDIRYSREATYDELREQNTTLQQQVEGYAAAVREAKKQKANAEYWKGQTQRTKQPTVRQDDIDKLAKSLIKRFDGTTQVEDINGDLKALAEYIIRDGDGKNELTYRAVKDKAVQIARTIVNSAEVLVNDEAMSDYKAIKKYLRENKIAFDGKGQITDWADFIRRNRGRIIIAKNGTPIDMLWGEMGSRFGYSYFPSGLTSADKMLRLEDVLDDMEPVYDNPFSRDMAEAIEYCANALLDEVLSEAVRQSPPTFADKQAAKMQRIKWREQDKAREALKRVRKDRDKKIAALKEHYKAKESKGRESRKARELREKIDRHVKDLRRQLLQPSDKQHIPEALRQPVANLLAAINMESSFEWDGTRRVPKGTPNAQATKRTEAFNALRTKYKAIADELVVDPDLVGSDGENGLFDDVIALGNKPIASMTSAELETVWQTLRAIESSIRTANKMFAVGRFQTVREAAEELRFDNGGKKAKVEYVGPLDRAHRLVSLDMLTPEAYFHRLGESGDALFKMMRKAQDKYIEIMKAAADFTAKLKSDVKKLEKESHTVTLGGHEMQMTTAQLMELYVLARREQALGHIVTGGIMPEAVRKGLKKSRTSEPINGITLEELSKACSLLTAEQVEMAEKMQSYLSNEISDYGNEASMQVYNYKKFTEENYWPIRSNKNENKSTVEKDTQVTSVANRGFTKAVKPNANTSVMVGSIFDTFSRHASEMATYAAWLGVTEDINRIRNFQFRDDEGNRTGTVKGLLDKVHGSQGGAYLQKLLSDISLGVRGNELEYMGGLVSNYKAASVGANLRVIIQQPTAILRAMDMIDPKYLVGGLKPNNGWKKALKYAPIAQWKDWGYFDINTGRQMKDVLFDNDTVLGKARQISMMGASKMDSLAWGQLWNACELEMKAKHKDLKGEAFYKAVAKRFGEIVDHTQVVDGVLQRSQIMRSSSGLTKIAVSFMGEPTKQYNMLLSAAYDAKTTGDKKAKQRLARSVFAFGVSSVVNAAFQSIMDAIRDDDKEEKYWEKWLQAFTGFEGEEEGFGEHFKAFWNGNLEAIINPTQYIPYAKDVFSLLQGYDVSRMDMESVEKTLDAGKNMLKALSGEGKYTIGMASANLFAEAGRLLGIPIANLKREIFSFAMHAAISSDNYMMQYRMEKATYQMNNNSTAFLDILYQAYANDPDAYKLMYADMVKSGFDAEKIRSGMETRMKKAQNVTSVDDLKSRYLTPTQQTSYDSTMSKVKRSGVWKSATAAQRKEMEGDLYDLTVGNNDGVKLQEKIAGGNPYGVGTTEYLLYELAKDVVDQPNDNGNYGTYTNEETEAAIRMLGLSNEANHFLWMETHTSDKNEPNW